MANSVRYAVVGAGWISQAAFFPGVSHTGNSEVTALVTGDPEKAKALSAQYGIQNVYNYAQYGELLASDVIDAVYLALPNDQHFEYAKATLKAKKHLLLEKPMAVTPAQCRELIDLAKTNDVKLMVAYRLHFEPATLDAVEIVNSGKLGDVKLFSSVFTQTVSPKNHRADGEHWAGPLQDMGPYPINAVCNLFGSEPTEVFAIATPMKGEGYEGIPETVSVLLKFPGDRVGQFTVSYGGNPVDEYRVVGSKGDLLVSPSYMFGEGIALKHVMTLGEDKTEQQYPETDQFGGELKYFSQCVLDGTDPEPDGTEGLADVCIINAILTSLETGRPTPVEAVSIKRRPDKAQVQTLSPVSEPEMVNAAQPSQG